MPIFYLDGREIMNYVVSHWPLCKASPHGPGINRTRLFPQDQDNNGHPTGFSRKRDEYLCLAHKVRGTYLGLLYTPPDA